MSSLSSNTYLDICSSIDLVKQTSISCTKSGSMVNWLSEQASQLVLPDYCHLYRLIYSIVIQSARLVQFGDIVHLIIQFKASSVARQFPDGRAQPLALYCIYVRISRSHGVCVSTNYNATDWLSSRLLSALGASYYLYKPSRRVSLAGAAASRSQLQLSRHLGYLLFKGLLSFQTEVALPLETAPNGIHQKATARCDRSKLTVALSGRKAGYIMGSCLCFPVAMESLFPPLS